MTTKTKEKVTKCNGVRDEEGGETWGWEGRKGGTHDGEQQQANK